MRKDKLLTAEEVATRLNIRSETVRGWIRRGRLRGIRVGRLWRIRESALEEFLQEHWVELTFKDGRWQ